MTITNTNKLLSKQLQDSCNRLRQSNTDREDSTAQ